MTDYDRWKTTTPEDEFDQECDRNKREQLRIQRGIDRIDDECLDRMINR